MSRFICAAVFFACCFVRSALAQPEGPPPMTNLQVFPKDTPRPVVIQTMREFSTALGVHCEHCHVDEHEGPNPREDMASDEKAPKRVARAMMLMTRRINEELLTAIPVRHEPEVGVKCVTCHHGLPVPETLGSRLERTLAAAGADSAAREYRLLREDSTRGRYDFGEQSLNDLARTLANQEKADDALSFLRLNAEYYPDSPAIPYLMGEVYLGRGDRDAAIAMYKKSLAADSTNARVARRLKEVLQGR